MKLELLLNPQLLWEKLTLRSSQYLAQWSRNSTYHRKFKGTVAEKLHLAYTGTLDLIEMTKQEPPKIIYDIGANIGTWSLLAKACIHDGQIHSFEPLKQHINQFEIMMNNIPDITLHPVALGQTSGTIKINITNLSDASSILEPGYMVNSEFGVKKELEETCTIVKLDEYIITNKLPLPDFIKLDVQGYELEVLKGAINCLNHAKWILCEVSFKEYYQNQPLFHDIACLLYKYGYNIEAFGTDTPLGCKSTQADILFYRDEKSN